MNADKNVTKLTDITVNYIMTPDQSSQTTLCVAYFTLRTGSNYMLDTNDILTCNGTPMPLTSYPYYSATVTASTFTEINMILIHNGFPILLSRELPKSEWNYHIIDSE
jgi:hypothetical protein